MIGRVEDFSEVGNNISNLTKSVICNVEQHFHTRSTVYLALRDSSGRKLGNMVVSGEVKPPL